MNPRDKKPDQQEKKDTKRYQPAQVHDAPRRRKALLLQLDGWKLPNVALLRIAAHHRALGDEVELRYVGNTESLYDGLWDEANPVRYASLIFEKTRPVAEALLRYDPHAIVGGTGWNVADTLEKHGITTLESDYSVYPDYTASIGFTQRGCRLKCPFCVVPRKEGAVRAEQTIAQLWRGPGHARDLVLLDNDFFGQAGWREILAEIKDGDFRVSFCQGVNARTLTQEQADGLASVSYWNDDFTSRQLYCAWDSRADEARLFAGLRLLEQAGIRPKDIMVYVLVGYWNGPSLTDDDFYRVRALRAFGAIPWPMPFARTRELVGFARWVRLGDERLIGWADFVKANYRPEKLGQESARDHLPLFKNGGSHGGQQERVVVAVQDGTPRPQASSS